MPSLAELTDQYPQQDTGLPVAQPYRGANLGPLSAVGVPTGVVGGDPTVAVPVPAIQPDPNSVGTSGSGSQIIDKLLGLGGQERYQLWPEKVVRDAISAPHDIIQANPYPEGSEENSWFEDQRQNSMVPAALNMSALAGTGGLAGTGAELGEALGAGPFLRPALKVGDKIYKAPIKDAENPLGFGAEHSDALPAHLADDFYKKAMSGEDINDYNFGFVNHKGQFLDREKALDYGIQQGLVDPQNGKYGVLTSTMLADSSKPGTAIEAMAKTGQPFYSALEHNVNAIPQAKMTGDQWLGTLANKPGVKPEELDWTGVKDFLKERGNQPVSKSELQEHLQNNKVELKEVDKGELKELPEGSKVIKTEGSKNFSGQTMPNTYHVELPDGTTNKAAWRSPEAATENMLGSFPKTKYHSYQLAGGENYREKLLTLPNKKLGAAQAINEEMISKYGGLAEAFKNWTPEEASKYDAIHATYSAKPIMETPQYHSSHWDEPNILAHIRMNDRMIDGKKSLHLEEIQSDWHQQGRDKGYNNTKPQEAYDAYEKDLFKRSKEAFMKEAEETGLDKLIDKDKLQNIYKTTLGDRPSWEQSRYLGEAEKVKHKQIWDEAQAAKNDVPNAPFKKSWHELALKRMIREAAEKGYSRLSWTPGEAQAARYDLSKSVDKIAVPMVNENGTRSVRIDNKDGTPFKLMVDKEGKVTGVAGSSDQFSGKPLSDVVGKEMADKIMKVDKPHEFAGDGLKIGGEGMKGFYDQIIPKAISKISGEKVKTAQVDVTNPKLQYGVKETQPIHYIDISPALRDKALGKGFPLFSSTHIFTPVAGNPFSNEKKK